MDVEFLRYQFEDGFYGVITKNAFKLGVRHIQMVYMLIGSVMMGMVRGSTGIAVLAMVDSRRLGDSYIQIHTWDKKIQGVIQSAFFFGYAVMLLPSDLFLRRVGGKIGLTGMLLVNGALCVAMPTIANKGGWVAVWNANLFMGITHGCFAATNQTLLEKWLPPSEKKFFSRIIFGGLQLGIILSFPFNSFLSDMPLGWELIYYSSSMLTLAMAIVYFTLTASAPKEHQAIGDKELEHIQESLSYYRKKEIRKPWHDILRSPHVWAVIFAHAASNSLFIFFIVGIPAYFNSSMSVSWSASYSVLPFVSMWLMYMITSPTLKWVYNNIIGDIIHVTNYRKIINALGSSCIIIVLTLISNTYSPTTISLLFNIILASLGLQLSGYLTSLKDMSENYASTLITLISTVSGAVASTVPLLIGITLSDDHNDSEKWHIIFLSIGTVYTLCNIIYTVFGSNDRQDWDRVGAKARLKGYVKGATVYTNHIQLEEIPNIKLIPDLYEKE